MEGKEKETSVERKERHQEKKGEGSVEELKAASRKGIGKKDTIKEKAVEGRFREGGKFGLDMSKES